MYDNGHLARPSSLSTSPPRRRRRRRRQQQQQQPHHHHHHLTQYSVHLLACRRLA